VETVAKLDADNEADCADQQQSNRNALIDDVIGASGSPRMRLSIKNKPIPR